MALQFGVATRNARLNAVETLMGVSPTMTIKTGAPPANCAAANTGSVLATIVLPSDWMTAAAGGAIAMSGTWSDPTADASGTAGHFRIHTSGAVCEMQGTCSITAGAGDLKFDNDVFVAGQTVTITSFTITDGNA